MLQPPLRELEIRTDFFDFTPEPRGVVHLPAMHQFVEDDVIPHVRRCLDQPPVEGNRPAPRARTPAGFLIPHRHARNDDLMLRGQLRDPRWQFTGGKVTQIPFNRGTQIPVHIRNRQHLRPKSYCGFITGDRLNRHRFTAKQDGRSQRPRLANRWSGCLSLHRPLQPDSASHHESMRFGKRTPARHSDARYPRRTQAQHVAAGAGIPHALDRQVSPGHFDGLLPFRSEAARQFVKKLKLHAASKQGWFSLANNSGRHVGKISAQLFLPGL